MRRNPLLYSNPSEIEEIPKPTPIQAQTQESTNKSSFFFYFIILANSLLVFFVLGFIWFLFFKSPDIQLKEISNRLFGTGAPIEQTQQTIVAPEIKAEIIITPTQQEKDETQQAKLKQMREREELATERVRLEEMKAELDKEKKRANEAQQAIKGIQQQNKTTDTSGDSSEQALEIEQTQVDSLTEEPRQAPTSGNTVTPSLPTTGSAMVSPTSNEPTTNSTRSQVDLIMEALKDQQSKSGDSN